MIASIILSDIILMFCRNCTIPLEFQEFLWLQKKHLKTLFFVCVYFVYLSIKQNSINFFPEEKKQTLSMNDMSTCQRLKSPKPKKRSNFNCKVLCGCGYGCLYNTGNPMCETVNRVQLLLFLILKSKSTLGCLLLCVACERVLFISYIFPSCKMSYRACELRKA